VSCQGKYLPNDVVDDVVGAPCASHAADDRRVVDHHPQPASFFRLRQGPHGSEECSGLLHRNVLLNAPLPCEGVGAVGTNHSSRLASVNTVISLVGVLVHLMFCRRVSVAAFHASAGELQEWAP